MLSQIAQTPVQLDLGLLALAAAVLVLAAAVLAGPLLARGSGPAGAGSGAFATALAEAVTRFDAAAFRCRQLKGALKRAGDQEDKGEAARLQGDLAHAMREMKAAETALMLLLDPSDPEQERLEKAVGEVLDGTLSAHANVADDHSTELVEAARKVLKGIRRRAGDAA